MKTKTNNKKAASKYNTYPPYGGYGREYSAPPPEREIDIPLMGEEDTTLLSQVMHIQSTSDNETIMVAFLTGWLNDNNFTYETDPFGNIFVIKGSADIYPCVVAHMDTVHNMESDFKLFASDGKWFAMNMDSCRQVGIGGDDKVGIFMCLKALLSFKNIKVVFFSREEIGCIGSSKCDMSFFDDVSIVLQADRNGSHDFINHSNGVELFDEHFEELINPLLKMYGYTQQYGTSTDAGELKFRGLNVACANISCGYYKAHTSGEYIVLEDMMACWLLMYDILNQLGDVKQEHKCISYPRYYNSVANTTHQWWGGRSFKDEKYGYCSCMECYSPMNRDGAAIADLDLCESCAELYRDMGYSDYEIISNYNHEKST